MGSTVRAPIRNTQMALQTSATKWYLDMKPLFYIINGRVVKIKKFEEHAMRFNYAGNTYVIDFQRAKRPVAQKRATRVKLVQAMYPSTTVFLHKVESGKTPTLVGSAEVKCWVGDKFSFEAGRRAALRKLSEALRLMARTSGDAGKQFTRGLVAAMWDGYMNRIPPQKSLKEQLAEANEKIALLTERIKQLEPAPKQIEIVDAAEVRIVPAGLLPEHKDTPEANA